MAFAVYPNIGIYVLPRSLKLNFPKSIFHFLLEEKLWTQSYELTNEFQFH